MIRTSSETGVWAAVERGELSLPEFHERLEAEADVAGVRLDAARPMTSVTNGFGARPAMATAISRIRDAGLRTAALTNNWPRLDGGRFLPSATRSVSTW